LIVPETVRGAPIWKKLTVVFDGVALPVDDAPT